MKFLVLCSSLRFSSASAGLFERKRTSRPALQINRILSEQDEEGLVRELFSYLEDASLSYDHRLLSFSFPPTPAPTAPPTMQPTPSPTLPPSPQPTKRPETSPPSSRPTRSVVPPTYRPTKTPTLVPTQAPTLSGCETAYAYCERFSTCFIGEYIDHNGAGNGPWGWSIDLEGISFSRGFALRCDLLAGVGQCNLDLATKVGEVVIELNSVRYEMDTGVGGLEFHLYAGQCGANDRGLHLVDNTCDVSDMAQWARVPGQYSLVADGLSPLVSNFQFDASNDEDLRKGLWEDYSYKVFPLVGDASRRYLSAHAKICPCVGECAPGDTLSPTSAPSPGVNTITGVVNGAELGGLSSGTLASFLVATMAAVAATAMVIGLLAFRRTQVSKASSGASSLSESSLDGESVGGE